jgi:predicted nucleic acid-binding protein
MSNENPNNTPPWRNKLDELEHLPGSVFIKDAAWDKLYGRLRGNSKSKKIFWYWIAAACLLLGLLITLLNYDKNTSQPANKETAIKKQPKEIKKPVLNV